MLVSSIPAKFPIVWAASAGGGYVRTIPVASQIGINDGWASLTDGFPPLNFLPLGSGGVPPFGQDMNGILKEISAWSQWAQAGGGIPWDSSFSSQIGGYPKGATVGSPSTIGVSYLNLADNNGSNPESAPANWAGSSPAFFGDCGGTGNALTATLALQYLRGQLFIVKNIAGSNSVTNPTFDPGSGAKTITDRRGNALSIGDLPSGGYLMLDADGTGYRYLGIVAADVAAQSTVLAGLIVRQSAQLNAAATSVTFTADEIGVASALGRNGTTLPSYNQTLNVATTGAGGMDTGLAPISGFVYIYAIWNPVTATASIIGTVASSSTIYGGANMPAGYTMSALIAVWPTNGSRQLVAGIVVDRLFTYQAATQVLSSGTATTVTAVSLTTTVPVGARSTVLQLAGLESVGVTANSQSNVYNLSTGSPQLICSASALGGVIWVNGEIAMAVSQTLYYKSVQASVLTGIVILGYRI